MLGERKVSGTAAKLGKDAAYHHCTLLLAVDRSHLSSALSNPVAAAMVESNATPSVRSPVENLLGEEDGEVEGAVARLEQEVADWFGCGTIGEVEPREEDFPGLQKLLEAQTDWQWTHGKSPKFTVVQGAQVI